MVFAEFLLLARFDDSFFRGFRRLLSSSQVQPGAKRTVVQKVKPVTSCKRGERYGAPIRFFENQWVTEQ